MELASIYSGTSGIIWIFLAVCNIGKNSLGSMAKIVKIQELALLDGIPLGMGRIDQNSVGSWQD